MMKILDNSVITAMGREITSVQLASVILSRYDVQITDAVVAECAAFEEGRLLHVIDGMSGFDDDRIPILMDALSRRRNVLGKGELATISASLVLTADGVRNYVVLDEIAARKCASMAGDMPEIIDILGKRVSLNITGTVGLVLHLHELGLISDTEKQDIGFDLETGTFRISEGLLKLLR